jgi:hypothetical protein
LLLKRKDTYEWAYPETRNINERGGPGRGNKMTDNRPLQAHGPEILRYLELRLGDRFDIINREAGVSFT